MDSQPLVSVVMATYNRSSDVGATIKNIFGQDYRPLELIVVNDGSKDDTLAVLKRLQAEYDFKLIDNPQNLGLQKSLNIGIKAAKGSYIARIDDHDKWLLPDKTTKQVALMEARPDIGLLGTAFSIGETKYMNPLTDAEIRKQILMRCPFCHQTVLMRRAVFEKVGGYDEELTYSEDWDLWLKIGQVSGLCNMPDVTVAVEDPQTENSLSANYFTKQLPLNRRLVKKYLHSYPDPLKARLYHGGIRLFFAIIPPNSWPHRVMQKVFFGTFLKGKTEKTAGNSISSETPFSK